MSSLTSGVFSSDDDDYNYDDDDDDDDNNNNNNNNNNNGKTISMRSLNCQYQHMHNFNVTG